MRQKLHFSASGEPLSDPRYRTVQFDAGRTSGSPTLYHRGEKPGETLARALAGVDALGVRHWVVRIVSVDTEATQHVCDVRCLMARSRTCACSCGGVNHGAGLIQCQAA
jgi:hypothetical protein